MLLAYCSIISVVISFYGLPSQASSITLLNNTNALCEQDVVQFNCTVSSGVTYSDSRARLSINGSACIDSFQVNVDVPRVQYTDIGFSLTAPSALYTISPYLVQDNATQYRCCARVTTDFDFTNDITLLLAAPPFPASVNISTTFNSANSCTGTITLTWLAVTSYRTVTSYAVLLNGTIISTITTPMAMNSYTTRTLNLLEHYATYTVMATSCAGSSTSSLVMFIPPIITTVPVTTSTTNSDTQTTTTISTSTTQTATVPITTPTLPITTSTLPITTSNTNFDNVTLTAITTSPVNNIPTNSSTLSTSVPPNQVYCYLPCTTSTNSVTSTPPLIATTTNYTPITTGSSITNDATSDTLYYNTTPYLVGIIILVLLLLLSILANAILILFIIYSFKKNNSAHKNQQNTNTVAPTNTAHIYNYIDLNALAETNEEKHYYSEMATVVQSNTTTTATTTSNTTTTTSTTTTNDNTNDRSGYYNVSTYANLS